VGSEEGGCHPVEAMKIRIPVSIMVGSEPPVDLVSERHRRQAAECERACQQRLRVLHEPLLSLLWRGRDDGRDPFRIKEEARLGACPEVSGGDSVQLEVLPEALRLNVFQAPCDKPLSHASGETMN